MTSALLISAAIEQLGKPDPNRKGNGLQVEQPNPLLEAESMFRSWAQSWAPATYFLHPTGIYQLWPTPPTPVSSEPSTK